MGPRILIIDDHAAVRRGVQELLADALRNAEFGHAQDGQDAVGQLRQGRWDVAVLDLNLPGRGGLDLIRTLKDEQPTLAILVYSMHAEGLFGPRAIRAGADGYLSKDAPPEELVTAARTVLRREQYLNSDLAAALVNTVQAGPHDRCQLLSDREMQVLTMLARGKTPSEVGTELALSSKTVSTYRTRILEKLQLRTNADLVRYAIENRIVD